MYTENEVMTTFPLFRNFTLIAAVLTLGWHSNVYSNDILTVLALISIFIFGMPHGALDIILLKRISGYSKRKSIFLGNKAAVRMIVTTSIYLFVVVASFAVWLAYPTLCLVAFLIIGILHFRHDWGLKSSRLAYLTSTVVVCSPSLIYGAQIEQIFAWLLVPPLHAQYITQLMFIVCLAATFGAVGTLLVTKSDVKIISALSLIIIAACLLPPLLFFTLYFCAIHAVYHTKLVQKRNQMTMQELYQTSLFPMAATLVIFVLAYLFLQQINTQNSWTALIFIGLFAVTIPHIIIEFIVSKRLSKFTH